MEEEKNLKAFKTRIACDSETRTRDGLGFILWEISLRSVPLFLFLHFILCAMCCSAIVFVAIDISSTFCAAAWKHTTQKDKGESFASLLVVARRACVGMCRKHIRNKIAQEHVRVGKNEENSGCSCMYIYSVVVKMYTKYVACFVSMREATRGIFVKINKSRYDQFMTSYEWRTWCENFPVAFYDSIFIIHSGIGNKFLDASSRHSITKRKRILNGRLDCCKFSVCLKVKTSV